MADRPAGSAQGYIDPNWPPPGGDGDATIIIYGYTPNFALCVLALVLFFILGLAHGWQLFRYRTWYFSTMMIGIAFVRHPPPPSISLQHQLTLPPFFNHRNSSATSPAPSAQNATPTKSPTS